MNYFVYLLLFLAPSFSFAATLSITPSDSQMRVGEPATLTVFLSSTDMAANAVAAYIQYDQNILDVRVSKTGSILTLWALEPVVENGVIRFEGVRLNPGFTGTNGKLVTLIVTPRSVGTTALTWDAESSVLANDGSGTSIIQALNGATVRVRSAINTKAAPDPTVAPKATSSVIIPPASESSATTSAVAGTVTPIKKALQQRSPVNYIDAISDSSLLSFLLGMVSMLSIYMFFFARTYMIKARSVIKREGPQHVDGGLFSVLRSKIVSVMVNVFFFVLASVTKVWRFITQPKRYLPTARNPLPFLLSVIIAPITKANIFLSKKREIPPTIHSSNFAVTAKATLEPEASVESEKAKKPLEIKIELIE